MGNNNQSREDILSKRDSLFIATLKEQSPQPRFSIIQSTLAARGTFKLDGFTGEVYQLVADTENNELWQMLHKNYHFISDIKNDNSINYVLFTSTIAMRFTYLMNVNTGATWQLVKNPTTEETYFTPMR
jgi:hypothetical protein